VTPSEDALGSAAQEASRLLDSLREWLDTRGVTDIPIATGTTECKVCPICLMLTAVRERNPEVSEHLAKAGEALLSAARSLLADHEHEWVSGRQPDVERIDIDE
jgi:hypothetical protein